MRVEQCVALCTQQVSGVRPCMIIDVYTFGRRTSVHMHERECTAAEQRRRFFPVENVSILRWRRYTGCSMPILILILLIN